MDIVIGDIVRLFNPLQIRKGFKELPNGEYFDRDTHQKKLLRTSKNLTHKAVQGCHTHTFGVAYFYYEFTQSHSLAENYEMFLAQYNDPDVIF